MKKGQIMFEENEKGSQESSKSPSKGTTFENG
jgi:hypothetical protein